MPGLSAATQIASSATHAIARSATAAGWRERRLRAMRSVSATARSGPPGRGCFTGGETMPCSASGSGQRGAKGTRLAPGPTCLCQCSQTVSQGESPGALLPEYKMRDRRIHVKFLTPRNFRPLPTRQIAWTLLLNLCQARRARSAPFPERPESFGGWAPWAALVFRATPERRPGLSLGT